MKYFITRYPILCVRHSFRHKTRRELQPDWQLDTGGEMLAGSGHGYLPYYGYWSIQKNNYYTKSTVQNIRTYERFFVLSTTRCT